MPTAPTEGFLTRPLLRQLAGEKAYAAGEESVSAGKVRQTQFGADRILARVEGSGVYRVKIWRARGELRFSCSCPSGREDTFCEHCVAVGLTWVHTAERASTGGLSDPTAEPGGKKEAQSRAKLQRHLRGLERERLVHLLLEATDYDDILRRRLLMEAIGVAGPGVRKDAAEASPDFAAYGQILHDAIDAPDYVDYDAMPDYVHGVAEAVQPLGDLLKSGYAAEVIELVELALVGLDRASENIDGSDGSLNTVYDDLQSYHLEACRAARLDPENLAARLLGFELDGGLGVFNNAAKSYAEVLGPAGLAAWRKLLTREWSRLPALSPTPAGKAPASIDHRRFQIQALMENLAVAEGDLEMLTAVKQRDLSSPHDFLSLAEWHHAAGRADEAVSWAERGRQAFPDPQDQVGLRDFLIGAYQESGRHDEAAALVWEQFARFPTLGQYLQLRSQTGKTHAGWPAWRERALALTRAHLSQQKKLSGPRDRADAPDHSVLVEFLLADGADEAAWLEAQTGGCRPELWLQLAGRREHTHPVDSLHIYQARLGPLIAQGGLRAYQEAIGLLNKISVLLADLGRAAEVDIYRAEVRATHRQKRGFVKMLDASGH